MRYTDRLADAGIAPWVDSRGESYDNALAESIIGLFKTEVTRRQTLSFDGLFQLLQHHRQRLSIKWRGGWRLTR